MRLALVGCALLALAACSASGDKPAGVRTAPPVPDSAAAPAAAAGLQTYRGRFSIGFERSVFEGCWLDQGRYWGSFEAPPMGSGGSATYQIEFTGTYSKAIAIPGLPQVQQPGFGHLGLYDCEYKIVELLSSRRID